MASIELFSNVQNQIPLSIAEKTVRNVISIANRNRKGKVNGVHGLVNLPRCFVGKRVIVLVVEDELNKTLKQRMVQCDAGHSPQVIRPLSLNHNN